MDSVALAAEDRKVKLLPMGAGAGAMAAEEKAFC